MPLSPTDLMISDEHESKQNITVTISWNKPNGAGGEYFVEYFKILVFEPDGFLHHTDKLSSEFEVVTLDYNVNYTVNVSSVNCEGESYPLSLHNIFFGQLIHRCLYYFFDNHHVLTPNSCTR